MGLRSLPEKILYQLSGYSTGRFFPPDNECCRLKTCLLSQEDNRQHAKVILVRSSGKFLYRKSAMHLLTINTF